MLLQDQEVRVSAQVEASPNYEMDEQNGQLESAALAPEAVIAVSGLYEWKRPPLSPPTVFTREELRMDVDGLFPQMAASGTGFNGLSARVHWIAKLARSLTPTGPVWSGPIFYKNGSTALLPQTHVSIRRVLLGLQMTISGAGVPVTKVYQLKSRAFHPVEFEFDCVSGVQAVTSINTHAHPDRPADLPSEVLTIDEVYRRAGFAVANSNGNSIVPLAGAGADQLWTDAEMHDAMQIHWSRFANKPQWSLWTFFANQHIQGSGLGGIMFDDIGPNHRQGTALFTNSFIAQAPAADPAPAAWVRRMVFWTAVHEMGHAFNLAHAWQKHLGTPWIPLTSDSEARSFMNYPFRVVGGVPAFFRSFRFRFTNQELMFLRHAPERFVQMGNAAWFDHHGFQNAEVEEEPSLRLQIRANREAEAFEYLEPVVLELKLTNVTDEPRLVEEALLRSLDHFTIIVKKEGQEARQFLPFARQCWREKKIVLEQGESMYDSLFLSAGTNGWLLAEPGRYVIQACLGLEDFDVVSNPLNVRILPPKKREEEVIAQDYFSDEVARVLAFDGSRYLEEATDTLAKVAAKDDTRAAIHANLALGMPLVRPYKLVQTDDDEAGSGRGSGRVKVHAPEEKGFEHLRAALGENQQQAVTAAESLGHVDYREYAEQVTETLVDAGDRKAALENQKLLVDTLEARRVRGRKVAKDVVDAVRKHYQELEGADEEPRAAVRARQRR